MTPEGAEQTAPEYKHGANRRPQWRNVDKMTMSNFTKFAAAAALVAAGAFAAPAAADYPEKPVNVLVGFPPGGNVDITIRHAQPFFEKYLGGPIVVVNKPGASAALAYTEVKNARPDGYTIAMTSLPGGLGTQYGAERRYDVEDFEWIANWTEEAMTFFVHPDSPFETMQDMIDAARADPGGVTIAGAGSFGSPHLGLLIFQDMADLEFTWVPMQGSADMLTAVLGQHVDAGLTSVSVSAIMHVEGQVRVLAMKRDERWDLLPDVPTMAELGYPISWTASRGLKAPKGTPEEILDKLEEASRKTMEDPEFLAILERERLMPHYLDREDYQVYVENQNDTLRDLWERAPWR
jgi:tripartite-type tricarboxylate transporter receptor subunit TctC